MLSPDGTLSWRNYQAQPEGYLWLKGNTGASLELGQLQLIASEAHTDRLEDHLPRTLLHVPRRA